MSTYSLIAIADGDVLAQRNFAEACLAAEAGGATSIQIRVKNRPSGELLRIVEAVLARAAVPVVVNDRADVAVLAGAYGVHLGADDLPVAATRVLPGGGSLLVGVSVGTEAEAHAASLEAADYWGVGPVFPTVNKCDAGAPLGCDGLARLAGMAGETPVVAIGGITLANAASTIAAGARGVAAIGAIFASTDIERATAELRAVLDGVGA